MTRVSLELVPSSFLVWRDIFVLTYPTHLEYIRLEDKGRDTETMTRINPLLWDEAKVVFDESIQAFVVTKDDASFYLDLKGVYDREFNKIKWSDRVERVAVVRPYLVGFLQNSVIELKCIFNPNRVVQKIELLQSSILRHTVAHNQADLDSLYVLMARKNTSIKVLVKLSQIDPRL